MTDGATPTEEPVSLELRFFANFRQAVGQKTVMREYPDLPVRIETVLADLEATYPELALFDETGDLREYISVLKNGQNILHLEGLDTEVGPDDRISLFPPVAGG